jgi:prophage antirepressor-like protein
LGHPEHDVLFFTKQALIAAGLNTAASNITYYMKRLDEKAFLFSPSCGDTIGYMVSIKPLKSSKNPWVITEAGLYETLLRGHSPQTEPFRKWVTEEVLPTIDLKASNTPEAKAVGMDFEGLNAVLEAFKVQLQAELLAPYVVRTFPRL